jgi:thymidylate kinase
MKRARGRFVIFDRYTYDALLPSRQPLSRWQRLRRWILAYACPAPDLIVMLDAPGEILFARKGEHSAEYLERHRQAYLNLRQRFPQMIVVDAARDAEDVRRAVTSHMWRGFAGRLREDRSQNLVTPIRKDCTHESN